MERTLKIIVIVLAVAAVVLGYLIYKRDYTPLVGNTPATPSTQTPQASSGMSNTPGAPAYELTAEEKKALLPPSQNATPAEQQAFFELVVSVAKEAPVLELGPGCSVKPVVLRLKKGSPLTIKNTASVEQAVAFNKDAIFSIPAGSSKAFSTSFATREGGIYGYGCGSSAGAVGMLFVTE